MKSEGENKEVHSNKDKQSTGIILEHSVASATKNELIVSHEGKNVLKCCTSTYTHI